MSFFRGSMRRGAVILFCIALIVFAITFGSQFKLGEQMTYDQYSSAVGDGGARLTFLLAAFGNALANSAYLFFAACILDRADRFLNKKGAAE